MSSPNKHGLHFIATSSAFFLYVLTLGPDTLRERATALVASKASVKRTIATLKWLLGFSTALGINNLLSSWARNNWQLRSDKEQWSWPDEVAVVTGGSGGIGALVVKGLAEKRVKVAVLDVIPLPEHLTKYEKVKFYHCDVTSKDQVDHTVAEVRASFGPPTILCNNAGIAFAHTILDSSPEYLRKLFDVNIISHFYTIQAFLPDMINRKKGHIITTASMASFVTRAGLTDYAATKAGVLALHEGLEQELKHRYNAPEIKTSIVHPIYVRTPLVTSYAGSLKRSGAVQIEPETVANAIVKQILSGRSGQVILPNWMGAFTSTRGFPWWFQEIIRDSTKNDVEQERSAVSR